MADPRIITGIFARLTDGNQIYNYLITDQPYHDPALALQIVTGTAIVAIPQNEIFGIGERISFAPMGGSSGVSIGDIPLIFVPAFKNWVRYDTAGLAWEVKRGYENTPWSQFFTVFNGEGDSRPTFEGSSRIIVKIKPKLGKMNLPFAKRVFDDSTPNESLRNTTVGMALGEPYQVEPKPWNPNVRAFTLAGNLAQVYSVAEGGNPQTPQWVETADGFQILAQNTLPLTANISGPPAPVSGADSDVLNGAGQFEDWDSNGELQYPDLTVEKTDDATLTEGADSNTGVFDIQAVTPDDTGYIIGSDIREGPNFSNQPPAIWSNATIAALTNDDGDAAVANSGGVGRNRTPALVIRGLGASIPAGARITGLEIKIRARGAGRVLNRVGVITADGIYLTGNDADVALSASYADYIIGGDGDLFDGAEVLNAAAINDDEFAFFFSGITSAPSGFIEVDSAKIKIYYTEQERYVRMTFANALESGERYTVTINSVNDTGSLQGDWSNSVQSDDPQSGRTALIDGSGTFSYVFTAGQTDFDIFLRRGDNGDQELASITVAKGGNALNRFAPLQRHLVEDAGYNPDDACDNPSLELVQALADNPRLGAYIDDERSRAQAGGLLSLSLCATTWVGLDGKWRAAQLRIPQQPEGSFHKITNLIGESRTVPEYGNDLRDRVHAARNYRPLTETEVAGVTTNWTPNQQEQIKAEYRITEKVTDFDNIPDYVGGGGGDVLSISSIDPTTGDEVGGTAVAIYGSGFAAGATVTIGGNAATSVVVVDSSTITCETPAGTAGSVDVVVTVDGDSVTLVNGFEYEAPGAWTPASLFDGSNSGVWYDFSDTGTLFQDVAGTTPATSNGDPIGNVADSSGSSGVDLTPYNDDNALRAELDSSTHSLPVCYFDGSARMIADLIFGGDDVASVGLTVGIVLDIFDGAHQRRPFIFGDDFTQQMISYGSDNTLRFNNGLLSISGSAPSGLFSLIVRKTGTDSYDVWIDGTQQLSGGSHTLTQSVADYLTLGFGVSGLYSTVAVGEFFAVNESIGSSDITSAIDYFSNKWS